ncbi:very short patch repair endonuclease [Caballeronia sp. PC1]|nr:very short patch repair endonuclease [Caballeronia sp. PC1]
MTPEQRSRAMSRVGGKDTAPELYVRRALHAVGLRFRLHRRDLPGKPDMVLLRGIAPSSWSMDAFGMAMTAREVLGLNQTRSFGRRSSIATSTAITAREYAWKRSVGTSKQYGNVRSTLEWSG